MLTLRAIAVPLAALALIWLAMPGASFVPRGHLATPTKRNAHRAKWGEPWTSLNAAAGFMQRVREPVARRLHPIQPIFRVAQSWHLYRDGPAPIRRMEIWVDDRLVYRTQDDDHTWNRAIFRNRRIRPMAESTVVKKRARNRLGLGRLIVEEARTDFPDAQTVEIRSVWAKRGGEPSVHHAMTAAAPGWALVDTP